MGSPMHRLQVCLEERQYHYLSLRARRDGVSLAEVVRRLVQEEADASETSGLDELLAVAGIGEDRGTLVDGVAVSEWPERYLTAPEARPEDQSQVER